MDSEKKLVNYKTTIAGLTGGGLFTWATWKTFIQGIFQGFAADYNLYDGALCLGFAAMLFAVILIVKDIADGRRFTSGEKKKAYKAILLMVLLFAGGWAVAKYFAADVVLQPVYVDANAQGDFKTTSGVYYTGGSQVLSKDISLGYQTNYVTVEAANDTDYTAYMMYLNQTNFDWSVMDDYRGFNVTVGDDGITAIAMKHYDVNGDGFTTLLDSSVDTANFDLTDKGTTMEINCSWTLADVIGWKAAYLLNDPGDYLCIYVVIGSDYTETSEVTWNWNWLAVGSDFTYLVVIGCWMSGGIIPLAIMLDLFNKQTYRRKSYKSYKRR